MNNPNIAVYALHLLGGWYQRIHTEDVAVKCYELAPSRFSWTKYPQYPDLAAARYSLESAAKDSFGKLVEGASEKTRTSKKFLGWRLTEAGREWIKANRETVEKELGTVGIVGDRTLADRRFKELLRSRAFAKFRKRGPQADISLAEFAEALLCTVNAGQQILRERLDQIEAITKEFNKPEVAEFLRYCGIKFL
ncbi:MAG: hypothetical protein WCP72_09595 [Desulfomonile sp.]